MRMFRLCTVLITSALFAGQVYSSGARNINCSAICGKNQLISHSDLTGWLGRMRVRAGHRPVTQGQGYSYMNFVPYVTRESGMRTNLGVNNTGSGSVVKGTNPKAVVDILLVDSTGFLSGEKTFTVGSNELLQINDVITAVQGDVDYGWLLMASDEPIDVWASVILNSTNDPSIQIGTAFPARNLMIQSSVKSGTFQSWLNIINNGSTGGNVSIKIYDHSGQLLSTKTVFIEQFGMYLDRDIRNAVPGTYGQILIEAEDEGVYLLANSMVLSSNSTGAFFPAVPLASPGIKSAAGVWEGSLKGSQISPQLRVSLYQERSSFYGGLEIVGGSIPAASQSLSLNGYQTIESDIPKYYMQVDSTDSAVNYFLMELYSGVVDGATMTGKFLYVDEKGNKDTGTFTLNRTGDLFVP